MSVDSTYPNGLIQSPEIPESGGGEPKNRAIKDECMAREVINTLVSANRNRHIVSSRVMAKFNAERPYDQGKLESEGLGWRSNFTTKPLAMMIERVHPRFSEAVSAQKYLTNSALSNKWENSVEKTEKFRAAITKLFRSRKGWRNLVEDIAIENTMFGSTVIAWLDEFSWFPQSFKNDCIFLSDGTNQNPSSVQVLALKETYLPHELFAAIKDRDVAKSAGWNVEEVIKAINNASPVQLRDNLNGSTTTEIWYQNAQRDLTVGASYTAGASAIVVYTLLAQEVGGKVSHYRLAGTEMKEIFNKEDRFDDMESCIAFFAFQKGNGKMHGSKGIGREAYEMAGMVDRLRNEVVDRSILSGKTLIQGDLKNLHKFKMSVLGAMCIIPQNWTVLEQRLDGNVDSFLRLDAYFNGLADQLIGSVSPRLLEGERVTAAQVNLFAAREEEGKDTRISRFLEFFVDAVATMQSRACRKDVDDDDAKDFQKAMLKVMTREELNELADDPVAGTVRDLTPLQRQLLVQVAAEKRGNPLYNQRQLEIEDLSARLDSDFAKRVLLPVDDPTETAEQQRLQQMETALLSSGQPVSVSPRDNHLIHISALMPIVESIAGAIQGGETGTEVFEVALSHLSEHINMAQAAGVPSESLKPAMQLLKAAMPVVAKLKKLDADAEQLQGESEALDAQPPTPQQ